MRTMRMMTKGSTNSLKTSTTTTMTLTPSRNVRKGNSVEEVQLLRGLLSTRTSPSARQLLWGDFVTRYERLITSCVLKVLRRYGALFSTDDLDDLCNDVWVTLLRDDMKKLRQYDAERGFRIASFIGLVATNTTIDHLRGQKAHTTPLDQLVEDHASLGIEYRDSVEDSEEAALAQRALGKLTPDERAFVYEVFHAERSPEELARRLGVTTNTIYSRKFKIREKLVRIVTHLQAAA